MIRQAENQVVKKRGRPKKNSDIPILNNIENIEEDIILYFPKKIFKDNKEEKENNKENINNKEEINEIPLLSISENEDNKKKIKKERKNNVECIKIDNKNNKKVKKEKEKNVNNKKEELSIIKSSITEESNERGLFENKIFIYNINCPFEMNPDNTIILKKTNLGCLWDTYEINDIPYFLPDHIKDGKFYVIGWFCSLNCAVAYNIKLNDNKVLERICLLKYMYNIDGEEHITPSPNILVLKKFGGIQNINEYRNKINILKSSRIVYKPMICDTPMFEEILK